MGCAAWVWVAHGLHQPQEVRRRWGMEETGCAGASSVSRGKEEGGE